MASVSDKLLEYSQDSTLHGINHVTDKKRTPLQRIVWTVLFLASFTTLLKVISNGFIKYYSYPVTSKMEYVSERGGIPFPTVTICNQNMVRQSYVKSLNNPASLIAVDFLNQNTQNTYDFTDPLLVAQLKSVDVEEIGRAGVHRKEDMFLQCRFHGANLTSTDPCAFADEDLLSQVKTSMGFCYSFHPARYMERAGALMSRTEGTLGGLGLLLDIQQDEYLVTHGNSAGIMLLVHDPYTQPHVQHKGVSVPPGTRTRVTIKKTVYENLPPPYAGSLCRDTNPAKNPNFVNPLRYFHHYSLDACKDECQIEYLLTNCGCIPYYMEAPGVPICDMYVFLLCSLNVQDVYYADDAIEEACGCFHPCEETKYSLSVSTSSLPSQYISPSLQARYNKPKEYFKDNWIELDIFFEELGYTKFSQVPDYTALSLLAECGGLMGLFIGASVLTLAEGLEAALDTLVAWCSSRKDRVKTIHVDNTKQ